MEVVSTLLAPVGNIVLMVMDTRVDGKNLITTLVVGDMRKNKISQVGQQCLNRMGEHHKVNYPEGEVHLVEVRLESQAEDRVKAVFTAAAEGDAVMFWCRTSEVYDAVFPFLGLKHYANGFARH